jgi:glycosyltransferase involved in cell wall biosynthesis
VGADFERKGGDLLLRVFEQHFSDSAELHIVSSQAPEDLPGRVHVHRDLGPNDARLIALYASCDLLVLPTNADLVPWSVLEAMAMQLPVVSTGVGAIPEIVVHDVTGFIVPAGDAEALANAIAGLLSDPDLRRTMGKRGRERIENDFDAAINVPRILAVMKSLADGRRAALGAAT